MSRRQPALSMPTALVIAALLVFASVVVWVIAGGRRAGPSQADPPASAPSAALPAATPAPPAAAAAMPQPAFVDEQQVQALRGIVLREPANLNATVQLGNLLYDGGRYAEAIPVYRKAVELAPSDANVSTDLGTALWYSGKPDEAIAQFEHSLQVSPNHGQTLFNLGIVKLNGKQDAVGAAAAWQRLLETNPGYPDRARVESLLAQARQAVRPVSSQARQP